MTRAAAWRWVAWIRAAWGPGRTSIPRGIVGVVAAPLIAVALLPLPIQIISLFEHWAADPWSPSALYLQALVVLISYGIGLLICVFVGVPVWLALRHYGRESGRAYAAAGALAGLGVAIKFRFLTLTIVVSASQALGTAMCLAAGAGAALGFWLIAREPPSPAPAQLPPPEEEPLYVREWREYGRRMDESLRLAAEAETPQQMHEHRMEAEHWQAKRDSALPVSPHPPVKPGE